MLAFLIITSIIIISIALYNKKQKEIEAKREEDRKQKGLKAKQVEEQKQREFKAKQEEEQKQRELKAKQEEEQKQRELKEEQEEKRKAWAQKMAEARKKKKEKIEMLLAKVEEQKRRKEEEIAKVQEEQIRKALEEERKQRELKEEQEEKRKAWAQRMAEARLQKKLQKEKEEAEFLERKRKYCIQLENELNAVGVSFVATKEFYYDIFALENIEFDKIFRLLKDLSQKQIYRTRNQRFYIQHNFYITDINNEKLIEITEFDEEYCGITFYQEDREDIEFNKGNAIKQAEDFLFCYLGNRKIKRLENSLLSIIENGITQADKLSIIGNTIEEQVSSALENSNYDIDFQKNIDCAKDNDMLIVDYELPNMSNISDIKEYKYIASKKEISIKKYTDNYIAKRYEDVLYSII